jgi:ubiquinone/menaquinone biosynthesis C-methylase UbiE
MKRVDRLLQTWRIRKASKMICQNDKVLDIGCYQGEFLEYVEKIISLGIGYDPLAREKDRNEKIKLYPSDFFEPLPFPDHFFDAIVMLASIEHISDREMIAREGFRLLKPGGRVIITVPQPAVDYLLDILIRFRLAAGMSLEQHSGFKPSSLIDIFSKHGFRLKRSKKFQLGFNNLIEFERN